MSLDKEEILSIDQHNWDLHKQDAELVKDANTEMLEWAQANVEAYVYERKSVTYFIGAVATRGEIRRNVRAHLNLANTIKVSKEFYEANKEVIQDRAYQEIHAFEVWANYTP